MRFLKCCEISTNYFNFNICFSFRSNLRPGSAGALPGGSTGRPLGVIPPLSNSAPERPHSNTSLSSSDSAPGSTVSSSRSSSRDPLPPLSSFASIGAIPPTGLPNPSTVSYNGQPPAAKPPYGKYNLNVKIDMKSGAFIYHFFFCRFEFCTIATGAGICCKYRYHGPD